MPQIPVTCAPMSTSCRSPKPIRGSTLNRYHPLSRGLSGAWLLNEYTGSTCCNILTPISSRALTLRSDAYWSDGGVWAGSETVDGALKIPKASCGFLEVGTNNFSYFGRHLVKSTNAWSWASYIYKGAAATANPGYWFTCDDERLLISVGNGTARSQLYATGLTPWDNEWHNVGFVVDRDNDIMKIFLDGVRVAIGTDPLVAGSYDSTAFDYCQVVYTTGAMKCGYFWNGKALSDSEMGLLHRNPYCMFGHIRRPFLLSAKRFSRALSYRQLLYRRR